MQIYVFPMYLVFEGIDGAGKTSITRSLAEKLSKKNTTAICLGEPTFGKYGIKARSLIESDKKTNQCELLNLFTQDRREHVANKINPAIDFISKRTNFCILQDRGFLSAAAYHAETNQSIWEILAEQRILSPIPTYFIYIDIPADIALTRIKTRNSSRSVFDNISELSKIRSKYQEMAEQSDLPIWTLDGTLPILENVQTIIEHVILSNESRKNRN